ncbi:peptide/nickel transport system ATP-binding protein [Micromonospora phaseoli]|uniref:Peptide/nickel transport system ATP-binding protein n=1 Tax=Micromonospora phaseoli TaxID=1144548 RepID=A0A1H6V7D8_9ACTN|nr:ABC transporter ATP-binding protein [Micromonospora phaseoli]PZV93705.1 peptide/nickel transport system ATP-binding protein [Micromonospora phaseoli]GIJ79186.1 peptide ABC transporter ATP-binding protein [Micromonospora phaseoli]SEI99746.1 peptide/nickel transport system ATP-binding protein [Micromonospora phaseoli]
MNSLLEISDVEVEYRSRGRGRLRAVVGVSLDVAAGQIVGLVGESGCGKSSLARVAVGLAAPSAGTVRLAGVPVTPLGWRRRPDTEIGLQMVFQNPYASLNPRRTIGAQLLDGVPAAVTGVARRNRVHELLDRVGMPASAADRYPHQFSGGQRQRLAIARALAPQPRMIIADEPVTALDASSQAQVVNLLVGLVRDLDMGMLFISHDLALVHEIADVTAVMYLGRIVETAPTRELWRDPRHPYTRALIDAVPQIGPAPRLPATLAGEVPDPANAPTGCRFRPRCPHAFAPCGDEPPTVELGGRSAACWLTEPTMTPATAPAAH